MLGPKDLPHFGAQVGASLPSVRVPDAIFSGAIRCFRSGPWSPSERAPSPLARPALRQRPLWREADQKMLGASNSVDDPELTLRSSRTPRPPLLRV